ncbi:cupin domain-containing protein [Tropicimonas isoalkanivorans]|uniref:cupin domain-containing protein n=1 Tax=Tropicimonas isoalkanivorans TaxID=441112 RepID=UPI000B86CC41|nr:cupin domain-containing protein [Tropicimonas isoalkanivorans]
MSPERVISELGLAPHPEGGWYRETWIEDGTAGRPAGTAIYYLLEDGQRSHWHTVDATEIWHFYAGAPLALRISATDTGPAQEYILGPEILAGQRPQLIVPAHHWQSAHAPDGWALVGCTVSPGFTFDGFTLAPPVFEISTA